LSIADEQGNKQAFQEIKKRGIGPVNVLVSNAGSISFMETVQKATFESLWVQFDVNVRGSMSVVREFVARAPMGATLINTSSGAGILDFVPGLAGYLASKLATLKSMDSLHQEGRVLRVFNIQPGVVATVMAKEGKSVCHDADEFWSPL
jgi:NAD(P)-dependent dehydrogenase (short-subunit alcohol dehydrogenase family)